MRRLLLFSLILMTLCGHSETNFVIGAATYHLLGTRADTARQFKNKWSKDGRLIGTPLVAVEFVRGMDDDPEGYVSTTYFAGKNSIGGAMIGASGGVGMRYGLWRTGLVAGLYAQDASGFYLIEASPVGLPIGKRLHLAPIIGWELIYGSAMKWHLVVGPALALTYLSVGF